MLIHTLMSSRSLQFTEITFLTPPDPCQILGKSLTDTWQISGNSLTGPAIYLANPWPWYYSGRSLVYFWLDPCYISMTYITNIVTIDICS